MKELDRNCFFADWSLKIIYSAKEKYPLKHRTFKFRTREFKLIIWLTMRHRLCLIFYFGTFIFDASTLTFYVEFERHCFCPSKLWMSCQKRLRFVSHYQIIMTIFGDGRILSGITVQNDQNFIRINYFTVDLIRCLNWIYFTVDLDKQVNIGTIIL